MTQTIKQAFVVALVLSLIGLVCAESLARDKPETPKTGVYVSEIDNDWVELGIAGARGMNRPQARGLVQKLYANPVYSREVLATAEFACSLYNREAVFLSVEYDMDYLSDSARTMSITRIRLLFACAMPESQ